ncbi:MAG: hypothetical protein QNJ14_13565 [Woeseiaceae bacterium]|nr:hypothetical protein [Woeseiaceae bacterium]
MNYDNNGESDFDIDPAIVLLGLGYATCLCIAIGWLATRVI